MIWLVLMALCGWTAGKIVGGNGRGAVSDILLGITGALTVRFFLEALRVTVQDIDALLFSVWGAAGLPGIVRFLMKRRDGRVSARALRNAAPLKTQVPDTYVSRHKLNGTSKAA